jgi:hypothetical protein
VIYQRRLGLGTGYPERRKRVQLRSLPALPALSTTEPAPGSILISNKRWLNLDQKQEMSRSWSVQREYYKLLGSITQYTSVFSLSNQALNWLIVGWNKILVSKRTATLKIYRDAISSSDLSAPTRIRNRISRTQEKGTTSFPPGTLDHWTGTRLDLDQQQEMAQSWSETRDVSILVCTKRILRAAR